MSGTHKYPTISFRISPREREEIEAKIFASGMKKKDYFVRSCIYNRVCVVGKKETVYQIVEKLQEMQNHMEELVLSARGSDKCILTFYLPETELLIARILNRRTKGAVRAAFDRMEQALGTYDFLTVFGICLTDRGSEFGDPNALETGINGIGRMSLYYCDPMRSNQKGGIEEVHTLLRIILPKGTIFTHLTQWDVRKCVDHINGYAREKLGGATPYDLSLQKFGLDILRTLQLKYVAPDEVTLTPKLLK